MALSARVALLHCALVLTTVMAGLPARAASLGARGDSLASGFKDPPNSARPRVWWHWMNGNISKDGVVKDLEWMKRVGIGGAQAFDATLATPQIVDKRVVYMTPEWKDIFRTAAEIADKNGLELGIASSPGWSETGGPWVSPEDGMKKLTWSTVDVRGGRPFRAQLPLLPSTTGAFQNLPMAAPVIGGGSKAAPPLAAQVRVLAFPVNAPEVPAMRLASGTGEIVSPVDLSDGDPKTFARIPEGGTLVASYDRPQTIRSATLYVLDTRSPFGDVPLHTKLEASDDGKTWEKVAVIPPDTIPTTISFAPVTARQFRISLDMGTAAPLSMGDPAPGALGITQPQHLPARTFRVSEFSLSSEAKVDRFEAKAGFSVVRDYYGLLTSAASSEEGVDPSKVIDLTDRVRPDGSLDWTPPRGRWRIVRIGYSLTGTTNHPATKEATGLEVDKYDGSAVRRYLETYLGRYQEAVGGDLIGRRGLRAMVTDSTEVGPSNWTPRMIAQFMALRGYDPTPWLPALTGTLVGSRAQSDAFLYDFRRTLADLSVSEHYATIAAVAHERGLTLYGEALEDLRPLLGDDMAMRSHTDIPMAAMWTFPRAIGPKPTYLADDKGASSVAHVYGRPIVAAESMTSIGAPWAYGPTDLRRFVDLEFALGINRPVVHTSVHQPLDKAPGLSMMIIGQFFTRLEAWGEMAGPWVDYMARNSFLLQQGTNVADVAYFFGEEAPLTSLYGTKPIADAPTHYAYDFINADALSNVTFVDKGALATRGGARYRVLYLGGSSARMTLATLRRIADLVEQGVTVVGNKPIGSPSLMDDPAEFQTLVGRLWPGQAAAKIGAGSVLTDKNVENALASIGLEPDFDYKGAPDADLLFVHRKLDDGAVYYIDNRKDRPETIEARFRVTGFAPELWHADTGLSEPCSYRIEGNQTVIPLDLASEESVFVMFHTPTRAQSLTVEPPHYTTLATLGGAWKVAFQADRGAPTAITLAKLGSLTEQPDPGVKYFSGIATYTTSFNLRRGAKPRRPLMLDLGQVGTIAEIRVNGTPAGSVWHTPYRLDIGAQVKPGRNSLEVRVADLWVNRLIGDAQPGAKKVAFTTMPTYRADAPLRPSGLIGPVTLSAR